jgi:hypothetical protein
MFSFSTKVLTFKVHHAFFSICSSKLIIFFWFSKLNHYLQKFCISKYWTLAKSFIIIIGWNILIHLAVYRSDIPLYDWGVAFKGLLSLRDSKWRLNGFEILESMHLLAPAGGIVVFVWYSNINFKGHCLHKNEGQGSHTCW